MIKVHPLKKGSITLFNNLFCTTYLQSKGIYITQNPLVADIFISQSTKNRRYSLSKLIFPLKRSMIWTNEPRYDVNQVLKLKSEKERIMNVFSGDVFLHNLHFLGSYHNDFSTDLGINLKNPPGIPLTLKSLKQRKKFCAAIFSFRPPQFTNISIDNNNADLFASRQDLAMYMNKREKCNILGSKWPAEIKVNESSGFKAGNNTWWTTKLDLLKEYRFNLCYENTISPYYCTEKIWHAIAGGCIPIYYGKGTRIYETFPADSFIDASIFDSHEDLLNYIENITDEEHIRRYNICLKVMHKSCSDRLENEHMKTDILDQFIYKVNQLALKGKKQAVS